MRCCLMDDKQRTMTLTHKHASLKFVLFISLLERSALALSLSLSRTAGAVQTLPVLRPTRSLAWTQLRSTAAAAAISRRVTWSPDAAISRATCAGGNRWNNEMRALGCRRPVRGRLNLLCKPNFTMNVNVLCSLSRARHDEALAKVQSRQT